MTISFSGLASGLDTSSWIKSLTALKQAKVTTLQEQREELVVSKNTLSSIRSFFTSFRSTLEKITDSRFNIVSMNLFAQNLATSANLNVLSATATSEAEAGQYEVKVDKIASNTQAVSKYETTTTIEETTKAEISTLLSKIGDGVKAGTIEVLVDGEYEEIEIESNDTIGTFINKLKDKGYHADFNEKTGCFITNLTTSDIKDTDNTGIIEELHLTLRNNGFNSDVLTKNEVEVVETDATGSTSIWDISGINAAVKSTGDEKDNHDDGDARTLTFKAGGEDFYVVLDENETIESFVNDINNDAELSAKGVVASFSDGVFRLTNATIIADGQTNFIEAFGLSNKVTNSSMQSDVLIDKDIIVSETATGDSILSNILSDKTSDEIRALTVINNQNGVAKDEYTLQDLAQDSYSKNAEDLTVDELIGIFGEIGYTASLGGDGRITLTSNAPEYHLTGTLADALGISASSVETFATYAVDQTSSAQVTYTKTVAVSGSTEISEFYTGNSIITVKTAEGAPLKAQNMTDTTGLTALSAVTASDMISGSTFKISTTADLEALATIVNGGTSCSGVTFVMSNDIDLSSIENWTAIGTSEKAFSGTFDGNGYELSGLNTNSGLFYYISAATVKNLSITDAEITTSDSQAGIIAQRAVNSTIYCVETSGTIIGTYNGTNKQLGGIIGNATKCSIERAYSNVTITANGTSHSIGGIAGVAVNTTIIESATKVDINAGGAVGGIMGRAAGATTLRNVYSTGRINDVASNPSRIGGLIGNFEGGTIGIISAYSKVNLDSGGAEIVGTCLSNLVLSDVHALSDNWCGTLTSTFTVNTTSCSVITANETPFTITPYQTTGNIDISSMTVDEMFSALSSYGVTGTVDSNGVISFTSDDGNIVTGDAVEAWGITTTSTVGTTTAAVDQTSTAKVTYTQTLAVSGSTEISEFYTGNSIITVKTSAGESLGTVDVSDMSVDEMFSALSTLGVTGTVDSNGVISFTSADGNIVTGDAVEAWGITTTSTVVSTTLAVDQTSSAQVTYTSTITMTGSNKISDYMDLSTVSSGVSLTPENINATINSDGTIVKESGGNTIVAIGSIADLNAIKMGLVAGNTYEGVTFVLTDDIEGVTGLGTSTTAFMGTINGRGHTITVSGDSTGIFTYLNGTVQNLNIAGSVSFSGGGTPGGVLAQFMTGGTILNCTSSATITGGGGSMVGGLVGSTQGDVLIENSKVANSATINSYSIAGGLVASVYSGSLTVKNSTVESGVISTMTGVGGIIGSILSGTTVTLEDVAFTGTMASTATNAGGLVGTNLGTLNLNNCIVSTASTIGYAFVANNTGTLKFTDSCLTQENITYYGGSGTVTGSQNCYYAPSVYSYNHQTLGFGEQWGFDIYGNYQNILAGAGDVDSNKVLTIKNQTNAIVSKYTVNDSTTFDDLMTWLNSNGITATMADGVISLSGSARFRLEGAIAEELGIASDSTVNTLQAAAYTKTTTIPANFITGSTVVSNMYTIADVNGTINSDGTISGGTIVAITSDADLMALANSGTTYTGIHFIMTEDIDLGGVFWAGINLGVNSVFDGHGHTIKGSLLVTNGGSGFFNSLTGATVQNLTFNGTLRTNSNVTNFGFIGSATQGTRGSVIANVFIENSDIVAIGTVTSLGGIVGSISSTSTSLMNIVDNVKISNSKVLANSTVANLGGVAGYATYSKFSNMDLSGTVEAYSNVTNSMGGVVGNANMIGVADSIVHTYMRDVTGTTPAAKTGAVIGYEVADNYQSQISNVRCYIEIESGAEGLQTLNIITNLAGTASGIYTTTLSVAYSDSTLVYNSKSIMVSNIPTVGRTNTSWYLDSSGQYQLADPGSRIVSVYYNNGELKEEIILAPSCTYTSFKNAASGYVMTLADGTDQFYSDGNYIKTNLFEQLGVTVTEGTYTTTTGGYNNSSALTIKEDHTLSADTTWADLGLSGELTLQLTSASFIFPEKIRFDSTISIADTAELLDDYGITLTIQDGKAVWDYDNSDPNAWILTNNSTSYSEIMDALNITTDSHRTITNTVYSNETEAVTNSIIADKTLTADTTWGELGLSYITLYNYKDGSGVAFTLNSAETIAQTAATLRNTYGIRMTVTDNKVKLDYNNTAEGDRFVIHRDGVGIAFFNKLNIDPNTSNSTVETTTTWANETEGIAHSIIADKTLTSDTTWADLGLSGELTLKFTSASAPFPEENVYDSTMSIADTAELLDDYGITLTIQDGKAVWDYVDNSDPNAWILTNELSYSEIMDALNINSASHATIVTSTTWSNTTSDSLTANVETTTSDPVTYDTKLSDLDGLNITPGAFNLVIDNVTHKIDTTSDSTLGSLKEALEIYDGVEAELVNTADGLVFEVNYNGDIRFENSAEANASNIVEKLLNNNFQQANRVTSQDLKEAQVGLVEYTATEESLLSDYDNGENKCAGELTVNVNGEAKTITITSEETFGTFIDKLADIGVNATLQNGTLKIDSLGDTVTFDAGASSKIVQNLNLVSTDDLGLMISDTSLEEKTSRVENINGSVAGFAGFETQLSMLGITSGAFTIYRDGQKAQINVDSNGTFEDLQNEIHKQFGDVNLKFEKGYLEIYSTSDDIDILCSASNDTSNIASILGLNISGNSIRSSRELYMVKGESKLTTDGLFKKGQVTEGTFVVGNATFTIDENTTLNDIISQINSSSETNATAYWDSVAGNFVIKSRSSGASLINIEAGTSNFTDIVGFTSSEWNPDGTLANTKLLAERQELGGNAEFTIDGTKYTSTSNTVGSDITKIKGVTLDLKAASNGETVTVTVGKDYNSAADAMQEVVDAYNTLIENVDKELAADGKLNDESTLKFLRNQIRNLMMGSISGGSAFTNLASIGISTEGASANNISVSNINKLEFNKEKFIDAFKKDSQAVEHLLVGNGIQQGILTKVENIVENSVKAVTGYFSSAENSYTKQISRLDAKIEKANAAVATYKSRLEQKFQYMDMMISKMQEQFSTFLGT